jgi:hypothetical protein
MKKKLKVISVWFILLFFFLKNLPARAAVSCAPLGKGEELCIDLEVNGNSGQESMTNFWPLQTNFCWKFGGVNRRWSKLQPFKLQIKIEAPRFYEGQLSTPVDFVKNNPSGYWGLDQNLNLRWLVVNFGQSNFPYFWANGDIRYDRNSLQCVRRFRYDSLDQNKPPYIIMPAFLKPNLENNGLTNSFCYFQQYYACSIAPKNSLTCDCQLEPLPHKNSWFVGITNAKVKVPYFQNQWIEAKRIEFVELSTPKEEQSPSAPYTNDINLACRTDSNGQLIYRGTREDWYFVEGIGPVLILTRDVGMPPDNECIYYVARESLNFQNADSYSYLVAKDDKGYDSNWNFSLLSFLADFNQNGIIDSQDIKELLRFYSQTNLQKDLFPEVGDNKINLLDFAKLRVLASLQ